MKRFAGTLTALLALASIGLVAYDGPTPLITYDRTISGMHVVLTTQSSALAGGRNRFVATIEAPITAANVGQLIRLQIYKYIALPPPGEGDKLVDDSCVYTPIAGDVGTTVTFTCEIFQLLPPPNAIGSTVEIYPKVTKNGTGGPVVHDGRDFRITVPVTGDDAQEENDTVVAARAVAVTAGSPTVLSDLVSYQDADYFKFVAPAGTGSADIKIEFWDASNNIDLEVYGPDGATILGQSPTSNDIERVIVPVTPGSTYYVLIKESAEYSPVFYDLTITLGPAHVVTAAPAGTPNPVQSSGTVNLSANASDTLGHALSYNWSQSCSASLSGLGTFSNRFIANPTWTAPANTSGTTRTCTIRVEITDGITGLTIFPFSQAVADASHTITFSTPPGATPNPVSSGGTTNLNAVATDSVVGHTLTYGWTATCPGLGGNGSFSSPSVQNPAWTAPANLTGSAKTCTMTVTVTDNTNLSTSASYTQTVNAIPDAVTITAGPTGTPNPIASGGLVTMSVTASDTLGHLVGYQWTAVCAGGLGNGSFSNPNAQNPTWTAPVNVTGTPQNCNLNVLASDGFGQSAAGVWVETVNSVAHSLSITAGPSGAPNPVASGGAANLSVTASDTIPGHTLGYAWSASCAGGIGSGSFNNAALAAPVWTAPTNATGAAQACTVQVTVNDGAGGLTQTGSYTHTVNSIGHSITLTAGPSGAPNPVASGGAANLSVTAADTIAGHTLGYAWSATCAGGIGTGSFANGSTATPTWTAPVNATGIAQACTVQVSVNDGAGGLTQTGSYTHTVNSVGHSLTITGGPSGLPNPVASGAVANLTVTATDSIVGHTIGYAWTASCGGGLGNGTFSSNAVATPAWTAPANATGSPQNCLIQVTVNDGAGGLTQTASYSHTVNSVGHTLTITAGPAGTPNPVASGGIANLSVTASDSIVGHILGYVWSSTCAAGLAPGSLSNNTSATPTWTAPVNATGNPVACTIQVIANDGPGGLSQTVSYTHTVNSIAHTLTITAGPGGTPNPVASGGAANLSVTASDSIPAHTLAYNWTAACSGGIGNGSFTGGTTATPTWTAPVNATGAAQTCNMQVVVNDGAAGLSQTGSYTQTVNSVAHTLTITQAPTGTPNPVASGGIANLSVAASDTIVGHTLAYAWTASCGGGLGNGTFSNAAVASPTWTAPANATGGPQNCLMQVVVNDGAGGLTQTVSYTHTVNSVAHTLTITGGPNGTPNPVASGGAANLSVTASDSIGGHTLGYVWSAVCGGGLANGAFSNNTSATPTWTAPANATGNPVGCAIQVVVNDGPGGLSQTVSYTQTVNSVAHSLTVTAGPTGNPNPVASGGIANLTVTAVDSIVGHALGYAWSATCPGGIGTGSFNNPNLATPAWTAPANATGSPQGCTIQVIVNDGAGGLTQTASYTQTVNSVAHSLTITAGPGGAPNPIASGAAANLSVTASDSVVGHTLGYAWSAVCDGGIGNGTFSNGTTATPTWQAPTNATGVARACTIGVTVNDGAGGLTQTANYTHTVNSVAHTLSITTGPSGTPNAVGSGGTANLTVTAVDSIVGHTLGYNWSVLCAGGLTNGTLTNGSTATPTWQAPVNATGNPVSCTVNVTVNDGAAGLTQTGTYTHIVSPVGHTLTITGGPSGLPNPVASGAAANLTVTASDSILGHTLGYAWSAACQGGLGNGTFAGGTTATPTWTAPANATGAPQNCTIQVVVNDGPGNLSQTATYTHVVNSVAHTLTITAGPGGTPNPVGSGGIANLTVTAADSIVGHSLTYAWSAVCTGGLGNGTFNNTTVATPTWTAPVNATGIARTCSIQVVVGDGAGGLSIPAPYTHTVNSVGHSLTITAGPGGTPNPVASGGTANLTVTAVDSIVGHTLAYTWSATCAGGIGTGTFTNGTTATPTWQAPSNNTGSAQACTIQVIVNDGAGGLTQTVTYTHTVNSLTHSLTLTSGPSGSPNPVASGGTASLSVVANDTLSHTLGYTWSAVCAWSPGNGTFANGNTATPSWTAPVNATASAQTCTIQVTVNDGAGGLTQTASYSHTVAQGHTLTITAGPGGTPNPAASGAPVSLTVTAVDSLSHALTYAWTANCSGGIGNGTFTGGTTATPVWQAPANSSGVARSCTIGVTVADGAGGLSQTASYTQTVNSVPHTLTITGGPSGTPNPVGSGNPVALTVTAVDSLGTPLTYAWSSTCLGTGGNNGSFSPNAAVRQPTWTAPDIAGAKEPKSCFMSVTVSNGGALAPVTGSYFQTVNPPSTSTAITVTAGPSGTPNPVASGGTVTVSVTATTSPAGTLAYAWSATCPVGIGNGTFTGGSTATPSWTAPSVPGTTPVACTIEVAITNGAGGSTAASYVQQVLGSGCNFTLAPTATSQGVAGGSGSVGVTAANGCAWLSSSTQPWLVITSGNTGSGNGTIFFTVAPNTDPAPREAFILAAGQQIPVTQAGAGYTYYFAEGATIGGFFETRFALLNADPLADAAVSLDFQLKDTATVLTHTLVIPAHTRRTIDISQLGTVDVALAALASAEFSTVVRSDRPLVADRTMSWDASRYGSHAETAIAAPATTWYLAEGATIGDFELYYLIQNPNNEALTFTVTYLLPPPAAPIVRSYAIGANTRTNIPVHLEPGLADVEVSAVIEAPAGKPIIVERAMYLSTGGLFYGAGHESAGITAPATQWFFAEGATGEFFDLFILIGNPGTTAAQVTATFLFDDGTTCATTATVDPKSRFNFWVDTVVIPGCPRSLADAAVSTTITADVPVIAERSMWWPGPSAANWAEAHNAAGATTTGVTWGLAGGEQGGARATETYILIANTSAYAGTAQVTLYLEDGSTLIRTVALPANSRTNVAVGAEFGAAVVGRLFGAVIASQPVPGQAGPAQLVVERAMYSNGPGAPFWAAGTDVLATRIQ